MPITPCGLIGAWGFADFGGPPADAAWIRQAALSLGVTLSGEPDGRCMLGRCSEAAVIQEAHESQQGLRHPFLTLVADAQLHNRDGLIQSLGLPPAASKPYSDGELILASYPGLRRDLLVWLRLRRAVIIRDNCQLIWHRRESRM